MSKVIILKGLPASGKSSWSKDYMEANPNTKRVNKDLLREMVDSGKWSRDNEKYVLQIQDKLILDYLENGFDVICDNTNLAPKHETRIRQLVGKKAEVEVNDSFMAVPIEECIRRDRERANSVGEKVIRQMYEQFVAPLSKEQRAKLWVARQSKKKMPEYVEYNHKLPDAVISDVDGSVALMGDRSPFDYLSSGADEPHEPVIMLLQEFVKGFEGDLEVFFVTGREDFAREVTRDWLYSEVSYPFYGLEETDKHLFMRKSGDYRKDVVIKQEIYRENFEGKYNVLFVLDDRDQTVAGWRELGLPTFQVAPGDF